MKNKIIFFVWIVLFMLFYNNSYCQTAIENDNIYGIGFFSPYQEIKENKVKIVREYISKLQNKKSVIKESHYDINGYLIYRKNIDPDNLNGFEVVTIQNNNYATFNLERQIKMESLLRIGDNPNSFSGLYFALLRENDLGPTNVIKVKSTYEWAKDSTLMYSTYVNGKKIDSGFSIQLNTLPVTNPILRRNITFSSDSIVVNDTLVITNLKKINDSTIRSDRDFFYGEKLVMSERKSYLKGSVWFQSFTTYKYDAEGRKIFQDFFYKPGMLSNRKSYKYENGSQKFTVVEEEFSENGKIKSTTKYDTEGRIIEKSQIRWVGKFIDERMVYKYLANGLLEEKLLWNDDELIAQFFIEYETYPKNGTVSQNNK